MLRNQIASRLKCIYSIAVFILVSPIVLAQALPTPVASEIDQDQVLSEILESSWPWVRMFEDTHQQLMEKASGRADSNRELRVRLPACVVRGVFVEGAVGQ